MYKLLIRIIFLVSLNSYLLIAQGSYPILYWTDQTDNHIRRSHTDGSYIETINSNGGSGIIGIDIDISSGKIYWTDHSDPKIRRSNLNGTNVETLINGVGSGPHSIALDITNNKIYWTDRTDNYIRRSNLDGSNIENLVTSAGSGITGIDLDISNSKMYWADQSDPKIRRSNLNGSNVEILVSSAGSGPDGLTLDLTNNKIYWTDQTDNNIRRSNLDGTSLETVISNAGSGLSGISLDLHYGKIYWIDKTNPRIRRSNLDGSNIETVISPAGSGPEGITIDLTNEIPLSVELTNFHAYPLDNNVCLKWTTESELNNLGFIIERSTSDEPFREIASYINDDRLRGYGNCCYSNSYCYVDKDIQRGCTYWYKLIDVDYSGIQTEHEPISIKLNDYPNQFTLDQNYPNPFNPTTSINFTIPEIDQESVKINFSIYTIQGEIVRTLYKGKISSGDHTLNWDGKNDSGFDLPSGTYIYRIESNSFINARKMIKLK